MMDVIESTDSVRPPFTLLPAVANPSQEVGCVRVSHIGSVLRVDGTESEESGHHRVFVRSVGRSLGESASPRAKRMVH